MKQLKVKVKPKKTEGTPPPAGEAPPSQQTAALTKKSLAALQRSHKEDEEKGKVVTEDANLHTVRPTSGPGAVPVAGAAGLSAHRAGSAPERDNASVISSSTANHSKRHQQQQGEVKFTSFLDELPVEACLEYLTRPHRSWDSAAKSIEYRRERIEGHNASVFARSLNVSRNSSYMESSMRSIASAPAGFPRSGANHSKTKTGSLVPGGRLGAETPPAAMDAAAAFDLTVTSTAGPDRTPSRASNAGSQRSTSPAAVVKGSTVRRPAPAAKKSAVAKGKKGGKDTGSKQGGGGGGGGGGGLDLMIEPTVMRKK